MNEVPRTIAFEVELSDELSSKEEITLGMSERSVDPYEIPLNDVKPSCPSTRPKPKRMASEDLTNTTTDSTEGYSNRSLGVSANLSTASTSVKSTPKVELVASTSSDTPEVHSSPETLAAPKSTLIPTTPKTPMNFDLSLETYLMRKYRIKYSEAREIVSRSRSLLKMSPSEPWNKELFSLSSRKVEFRKLLAGTPRRSADRSSPSNSVPKSASSTTTSSDPTLTIWGKRLKRSTKLGTEVTPENKLGSSETDNHQSTKVYRNRQIDSSATARPLETILMRQFCLKWNDATVVVQEGREHLNMSKWEPWTQELQQFCFQRCRNEVVDQESLSSDNDEDDSLGLPVQESLYTTLVESKESDEQVENGDDAADDTSAVEPSAVSNNTEAMEAPEESPVVQKISLVDILTANHVDNETEIGKDWGVRTADDCSCRSRHSESGEIMVVSVSHSPKVGEDDDEGAEEDDEEDLQVEVGTTTTAGAKHEIPRFIYIRADVAEEVPRDEPLDAPVGVHVVTKPRTFFRKLRRSLRKIGGPKPTHINEEDSECYRKTLIYC